MICILGTFFNVKLCHFALQAGDRSLSNVRPRPLSNPVTHKHSPHLIPTALALNQTPLHAPLCVFCVQRADIYLHSLLYAKRKAAYRMCHSYPLSVRPSVRPSPGHRPRDLPQLDREPGDQQDLGALLVGLAVRLSGWAVPAIYLHNFKCVCDTFVAKWQK